MTYDEFSQAWSAALSHSGLRIQGWPSETFDIQRVERLYEVRVEPLAGQDVKPFYVTALISWRWSALHFARTSTTEDDLVRDLLGRSSRAATQKPWLRVDMKLSATLPWGEPMPMPSTDTWKQWMRETMARLERLQPMLPKKVTRTTRTGDLEILAWQQGEPALDAICSANGTLRLGGVHLSAWQALNVPRCFSDTSRRDPSPHKPLTKMFSRLKASLHAWTEVMDHLREK